MISTEHLMGIVAGVMLGNALCLWWAWGMWTAIRAEKRHPQERDILATRYVPLSVYPAIIVPPVLLAATVAFFVI